MNKGKIKTFNEKKITNYIRKGKVKLEIDLGMGKAFSEVWTEILQKIILLLMQTTEVKGIKKINVVAVILIKKKSFLISKRPYGKIYSGFWEFPGGKVES